jgi:hypothetical protein
MTITATYRDTTRFIAEGDVTTPSAAPSAAEVAKARADVNTIVADQKIGVEEEQALNAALDILARDAVRSVPGTPPAHFSITVDPTQSPGRSVLTTRLGLSLAMPGMPYVVKKGDTADSIVAEWARQDPVVLNPLKDAARSLLVLRNQSLEPGRGDTLNLPTANQVKLHDFLLKNPNVKTAQDMINVLYAQGNAGASRSMGLDPIALYAERGKVLKDVTLSQPALPPPVRPAVGSSGGTPPVNTTPTTTATTSTTSTTSTSGASAVQGTLSTRGVTDRMQLTVTNGKVSLTFDQDEVQRNGLAGAAQLQAHEAHELADSRNHGLPDGPLRQHSAHVMEVQQCAHGCGAPGTSWR